MKKLILFFFLASAAFAQRTTLILKDTGSAHSLTVRSAALTADQTIRIPQTTQLVDFKGVWTAKDTTLATPLQISATSAPATAQFKYVVRAADIPSAGNAQYVRDWGASVGLTGQDTGIADETLAWQSAKNSHPLGADGYDSITVTGTQFYYFSISNDSLPVVVGDTLQIYLFTTNANKVNISKACIFIYPRTLATATNSLEWQSLGAYNALPQQPDTMQSGVLTVSASVVQGGSYAWDSSAAPSSVNDGNSIVSISTYQLLLSGIIPVFSTPTNNNNVSSDGAQAGLRMNSFRFQRYFRLITY